MAEDPNKEVIELQGELGGHLGWVTCITTAIDNPDLLVTGSRDKTIIVWNLERKVTYERNGAQRNEVIGKMKRRLTGHNHFISDIDLSVDRQYALSSSWDGTLRLWNLKTGETRRRFAGHKRDVLAVAFSSDNRQIVSGSRDKTVKVWNTVGVCKETMDGQNAHNDWVTCVRFSPNAEDPVIVSAGRDKVIKVWSLKDFTLRHNLKDGHTSYVNTVTVSPDGSLCASGGKDGVAHLWDLNEGKSLSTLDAGGEIYSLCFSPNRYWLCGAVGGVIKIWDLESKDEVGVLKLKSLEFKEEKDTKDKKKKKKKKKRDFLFFLNF